MYIRNLTPLIKKFGPGYVALEKTTGKVVAHARRVSEVVYKTKDRSDVVIEWIPKSGTRYVFGISL